MKDFEEIHDKLMIQFKLKMKKRKQVIMHLKN